MAKQIDWVQVEREYVEGDDNVTALTLAKKHARHAGTVRSHAAKNSWAVKRELFRKQLNVELRKKNIEDIVALRAERATKIEDILYRCIDHAAAEFLSQPAGSELQNAATALGIAVDKYHKQIGHDAQPQAASEDEAGERITIERWRHLKSSDRVSA